MTTVRFDDVVRPPADLAEGWRGRWVVEETVMTSCADVRPGA